MSYPEDTAAERDEQEYAEWLATYGIWHVCSACGERELTSPRSRHYLAHSVFCGHCTKEMLVEDDLTPELAGILLCRRAGAVTIAKDIQGHVWMYVRERRVRR